jgi:hypothetical protein
LQESSEIFGRLKQRDYAREIVVSDFWAKKGIPGTAPVFGIEGFAQISLDKREGFHYLSCFLTIKSFDYFGVTENATSKKDK